jgi:hypothetical protein
MRFLLLVIAAGCNQAYGLDGTRPLEEVDVDGDGIPDDSDNCPEISNANQADEDRDTIGNLCDNCPLLANRDQANVGDTDRVGDACDPHPEQLRDCLLLFDSFDDPDAFDAHWMLAFGSSGDVRREAGFVVLEPEPAMPLTIVPLDDNNAPFTQPTQAVLSARASTRLISLAVGMTEYLGFRCGVTGVPPMQFLVVQVSGRTQGSTIIVSTTLTSGLEATVGDNLLVDVRAERISSELSSEPFRCVADYGISLWTAHVLDQVLQDPTGVTAIVAEGADAEVYGITATRFVAAGAECPPEIRR